MLKICVLIPHYHTGEKSHWILKQCLRSLKEVEPGLLKHTLILDDASPDPGKMKALESLKEEMRVSLIFKKKNTTFSDNVNLGLRLARQCHFDVALLLNNDVELKTPIREATENLFRTYPKTTVIGARLYYPTGRLQHQGFNVTRSKGIDGRNAGGFDVTERPGFVMGVTGALQILNLFSCGSYPPNYSLSYEDVAFCLREWEQDRWVYYEPQIYGIHAESATRGYQIGVKEYQSLMALEKDRFDFDRIEQNLARAKETQAGVEAGIRAS